MPLKAVSFSMARRALLRAKPAAGTFLDALFPPDGACLFCSSKLEEPGFRPVCRICSDKLLVQFAYERREAGEFWGRIEGKVAGRIRVAGDDALGIRQIIRGGNPRAMAEISRAMATCVPPIRYLRADGVSLFSERLDLGRAAALRAFGRQLARSFACGYLGHPSRGGPGWQQDSIMKYGGVNPQASSAYPILICEEDCVNEAAALLIPSGAKEIIWADAGWL